MLSKEECEVCLNQFIEDTNYDMGDKTFNDHEEEIDILQQLIKKHFELVEKYEMLENTYSMICEDYLNPKPYKFEDLKECDYVYDKKEDEIVLIIGIYETHKTNEKMVRALVFGYKDFIEIPFKENRFYPVHIAK